MSKWKKRGNSESGHLNWTLLLLALVFALYSCREKDPYAQLVSGEDLGLGITLGSRLSEVEPRIEKSLGRIIAEHQISPDKRYFEFADPYREYSFYAVDVNQDGLVDGVMVAVTSGTAKAADSARRFQMRYPKVRTKLGITLGSKPEDIIEKYALPKTSFAKAMWVESSQGNLGFKCFEDVVTEIYLLNDTAKELQVQFIIGKNVPERW